MRRAVMDDENRTSGLGRITRAQTRALGLLEGLPPLVPSTKENDKLSRTDMKRAGQDYPTSAVAKRRAVLKDVTNTKCINYTNVIRGQHRKREAKKSSGEEVKATRHGKKPQVPRGKGGKIMESVDEAKIDQPGSAKNLTVELTEFIGNPLAAADVIVKENFRVPIPMRTPCSKEDGEPCHKEENLNCTSIVNIDSKHEDPQMCSLYAADIYSNLYVMQLARRPLQNYMETVQQDINHIMRAILIDWLVEVSDGYMMVPDTLYLTVNLLDRYLSESYIEKKKLQLLGITCMIIASKFEEICAPSVEEFCIITDNTCTREEVVKLESCVLNTLGFRLSISTTKKFLRRFIQAAQVSYKVPSVELEFLANYLAELTLPEYSFLKYLPSIIAASAIFLSKWTLDQSNHPWNPTLEHYTSHKASELKTAVLELQDLQINVRGCMLNAIREKYKQSKFKCVSTLGASKPVQALF